MANSVHRTDKERISALEGTLPQINERLGELHTDITGLRNKIDATETTLRTKIDATEATLRSEIRDAARDSKTANDEISAKVDAVQNRMFVLTVMNAGTLVLILIGFASLIFTIIRTL